MKAFLEVDLVGKTQPISLSWFPARQQTSTSRRQTFDLFYPKFIPDLVLRSKSYRK